MQSPTFNGYYLTLSLLLVCTVVGIIFAVRFRREVEEDLTPASAKDLLDPLERAYFSGLMRPEEIERVRASVQRGKIEQIVNRLAKPSATSKTKPDELAEEVPGDDPVNPGRA